MSRMMNEIIAKDTIYALKQQLEFYQTELESAKMNLQAAKSHSVENFLLLDAANKRIECLTKEKASLINENRRLFRRMDQNLENYFKRIAQYEGRAAQKVEQVVANHSQREEKFPTCCDEQNNAETWKAFFHEIEREGPTTTSRQFQQPVVKKNEYATLPSSSSSSSAISQNKRAFEFVEAGHNNIDCSTNSDNDINHALEKRQKASVDSDNIHPILSSTVPMMLSRDSWITPRNRTFLEEEEEEEEEEETITPPPPSSPSSSLPVVGTSLPTTSSSHQARGPNPSRMMSNQPSQRLLSKGGGKPTNRERMVTPLTMDKHTNGEWTPARRREAWQKWVDEHAHEAEQVIPASTTFRIVGRTANARGRMMCNGCGYEHHPSSDRCYNQDHPDCNCENRAWWKSTNGKKWARWGWHQLPLHHTLNGQRIKLELVEAHRQEGIARRAAAGATGTTTTTTTTATTPSTVVRSRTPPPLPEEDERLDNIRGHARRRGRGKLPR